jgi:DNA repair protein RadC
MAIKYAYRLETKRIKEEDFPYNGQTLSSPAAVVSFIAALENSDVEKMLVLHLNTKNRLNCIQPFYGTVDRAIIWTREIIKHAILSQSTCLILIHNHPSGNPEPSPEDKALTKRIKDAADLLEIRTLDHIVIGENGKYFSFQEANIL